MFHHRGTIRERLHAYEEALHDFSRAIELNPRSHASRHARAMLLDREGQHAEALAEFTKVGMSKAMSSESLSVRPIYIWLPCD